MKRLMTVSTVLALLVLGGAAGADVFVYPKQGQSRDQFQRDQFDCHNWAQGQTGGKPAQPVQVASAPPQQGGAIRGGASGTAPDRSALLRRRGGDLYGLRGLPAGLALCPVVAVELIALELVPALTLLGIHEHVGTRRAAQ